MSIEGVQKWVLSALAFTTIMHLSVGLVIAAVFVDDAHRVSQIGISAIAAAFGVIAVATALAIHKRPMLSPWLALGLLPGVVGIWLCLR